MTTLNGASHHNVDDLLASIRTSIADESGSHRPQSNGNFTQHVRRDAVMAHEAAEFELPAIFKPGHNTPVEKPNLFGRLSDALKTPPDTERSRTVIRFEPASSGRMIEPPQPTTVGLPAGRETSQAYPQYDEGPQLQSKPDPVKREMASFFDTRLNRIGEMTRAANTQHAPEPKPAPVFQPTAATHQPPMLPDTTVLGHNTGSVDDVAAQLLRPILKQWLTENMPKIVERALRSEADHDMQGSGSGVPGPRKTLR